MTLSRLLSDAGISIDIPKEILELELEQSITVCPLSFYPWLRSEQFSEAINKIVELYKQDIYDYNYQEKIPYLLFSRENSDCMLYRIELRFGESL